MTTQWLTARRQSGWSKPNHCSHTLRNEESRSSTPPLRRPPRFVARLRSSASASEPAPLPISLKLAVASVSR